MFTGIVAGLGTVDAVELDGEAARISVSGADVGAARTGDSIAVDGVCLTAAEISGGAHSGKGWNRPAPDLLEGPSRLLERSATPLF